MQKGIKFFQVVGIRH